MTQEIAAAEFKTTCLKLLDLVAESAEEIVITKHGRPVARLVPIVREHPSLVGSVRYDDDDVVMSPTGEAWDAEK